MVHQANDISLGYLKKDILYLFYYTACDALHAVDKISNYRSVSGQDGQCCFRKTKTSTKHCRFGICVRKGNTVVWHWHLRKECKKLTEPYVKPVYT